MSRNGKKKKECFQNTSIDLKRNGKSNVGTNTKTGRHLPKGKTK